MNNIKVKPIPELSVKFVEDEPVVSKLKDFSLEKNKINQKKNITQNEQEDLFFVHEFGDDTKVKPDNFLYLKHHKKFIDKNTIDEKRTMKIEKLPYGFFERAIFHYFRQFGKIVRIRVVRDPKTGVPKDTAFIEFGNSEVAKLIFEEFRKNPIIYDANKIFVELIGNDDSNFISFEESKRLIDLHLNFDLYKEKEIDKKVNESYFNYKRLWNEEEYEKFNRERIEKKKREEEELKKSGINYCYVPNNKKRKRDENEVEEDSLVDNEFKLIENVKKKRKRK